MFEVDDLHDGPRLADHDARHDRAAARGGPGRRSQRAHRGGGAGCRAGHDRYDADVRAGAERNQERSRRQGLVSTSRRTRVDHGRSPGEQAGGIRAGSGLLPSSRIRPEDAARCYRLAGAHRRAAELYETLGRYAEAAAAYQEAGLAELGAWLLVHTPGGPRKPGSLPSAPPPGPGRTRRPAGSPGLRPRLILARCEIAEGAPRTSIRPVIEDVCTALADRAVRSDPVTEDWAVALSEAAARYDQAALVFAAAVRGSRYGAAQRWNDWSTRVLDVEVVLPPTIAAA